MKIGRALLPMQLIREDISEEVAVERDFEWWQGGVKVSLEERAGHTGTEIGTLEWLVLGQFGRSMDPEWGPVRQRAGNISMFSVVKDLESLPVDINSVNH